MKSLPAALIYLTLVGAFITVPCCCSGTVFKGGKVESNDFQEINLGDLTPGQATDTLTWNANRTINGFRVEIIQGMPIVMEIRFQGRTEKWAVKRFLKVGQTYEQTLASAVQIGQIQMDVSQSLKSKIRMIAYVPNAGTQGNDNNEEEIQHKPNEVDLGTLKASTSTQSLVWDVNRRITGFRVVSVKGHPSVIKIAFLGRSEEWTMHSEINVGQFVEKTLSKTTQVGKIQVDVFKAANTELKLVVYSASPESGETEEAGEVDIGMLNATQDTQSLVWNVNRKITGFKVVSMKGHPTVTQVSLLGRSEKWDMHSEINVGQFVEKKLASSVQAGKVQVNVSKATGTRLKLIAYTSGTGTGEGETGEMDMGILTATTQSEQDTLTWPVNRRITGFRLTVKQGNLVISEVRLVGRTEKWVVGQSFATGQSFEKKFTKPVKTGDIQVDVNNARGNQLGLVVFTGQNNEGEQPGWDEIEFEPLTFWEDTDQEIWNIDHVIVGFRIEILKGRLTIDEAAFYRGLKWTVNKSFGIGQKFEQLLEEPTEVSKMRIKVRYAKDDSVKLIAYAQRNEGADAWVESGDETAEETGGAEGELTGDETAGEATAGETVKGTSTPEEELQKALEELLKQINY